MPTYFGESDNVFLTPPDKQGIRSSELTDVLKEWFSVILIFTWSHSIIFMFDPTKHIPQPQIDFYFAHWFFFYSHMNYWYHLLLQIFNCTQYVQVPKYATVCASTKVTWLQIYAYICMNKKLCQIVYCLLYSYPLIFSLYNIWYLRLIFVTDMQDKKKIKWKSNEMLLT